VASTEHTMISTTSPALVVQFSKTQKNSNSAVDKGQHLFIAPLVLIGVILLNLVQTGNLQFLVIFHNLAAIEQGFLPKTSKMSTNTPK